MVITLNSIPVLHDKKDKKDLINKYFLALIPLIIFSIYKNGILLYINDLIKISNILIPGYFYGISILIAVLISKILKEDLKENSLICLIIACTTSINTNMIIYPILLFISIFISKYILSKTKITFNLISFSRLIMILGLLINSYSYLNVAEKLNKFNYNSFDIMIGHGIGAIGVTSLILVIISLIILSLNKYYKKIIPLISSLTFIVINLIIFLITKNSNIINILLNGTVYFSFVFIAADIYRTPYHKNGMIIYALAIGILTSIISLLGGYHEASYISILLVSIFIPVINKIQNRRYLKK